MPACRARVDEVAATTTPDHIESDTGSDAEWTRLTDRLLQAGTFVPLDESRKPNNFCAVLDPTDVARVEDRTYICRVEGRMTPGPTTTGWTRTR